MLTVRAPILPPAFITTVFLWVHQPRTRCGSRASDEVNDREHDQNYDDDAHDPNASASSDHRALPSHPNLPQTGCTGDSAISLVVGSVWCRVALSRPGNGKRRQGDSFSTDRFGYRRECMDALKMLKEDHMRVKTMLSKLDETTERAEETRTRCFRG